MHLPFNLLPATCRHVLHFAFRITVLWPGLLLGLLVLLFMLLQLVAPLEGDMCPWHPVTFDVKARSDLRMMVATWFMFVLWGAVAELSGYTVFSREDAPQQAVFGEEYGGKSMEKKR